VTDVQPIPVDPPAAVADELAALRLRIARLEMTTRNPTEETYTALSQASPHSLAATKKQQRLDAIAATAARAQARADQMAASINAPRQQRADPVSRRRGRATQPRCDRARRYRYKGSIDPRSYRGAH